MASTRRRWMNPTGIKIGGVSAQDNLNFQMESSSESIGSSSENDKYANHFLQAVEKGDSASLRIFDMTAAYSYLAMVGSVKSFECYIPKASEGSATTGYKVESTLTDSMGAMVNSVTMSGGHNQLWEAEVTLTFRTPDGISTGMPLS